MENISGDVCLELESEGTKIDKTNYFETAIEIQNAWKWFKVGTENETVLKELNMTVPKGSLYCLLGSSGCGKTTLLSCIVGIKKLNKGTITVFGDQQNGTNDIGIPGKNVGYMPQDISLYGEFTIWETFLYFGTFGGMSKTKVAEKSVFLEELLELPPLTRRVNTLSGGQQRRVSFAVGLIHDPKLVILDEPTVGVDPLLRQKIWKHLRKLSSSQGITIIITTHYLEEARQADVIGIIREGRMIAETSPNQLTNSNTVSLQDAVVKLCKQVHRLTDENNTIKFNCGRNVPIKKKTAALQVPAKQLVKESAMRIKSLIRKNFTILFRNLLLLSFVIWIPAIELLAICVSFGYSPAHLRIGVINQELKNVSVCPAFNQTQGECDVNLLSYLYLNHVSPKTIELVSFEMEQNAESAVHSGSIWGYMIFPPEFSASNYDRAISGVNVDEITLNSSGIIVKLDETNKQIGTSIKIALHDALSDFTSSVISNCGFDSNHDLSPFQYGIPVYGKADTDLREYASISMAVAALFFWPILTVGIRFIEERKSGMMERATISGVTTWEMIIAYLVSEILIVIPQAFLALVVAVTMSGIKAVGSVYLAFGLLLLAGCCGASLGFLFGSICSEKVEVPILGLGSFMPNMILCGIFWPIQGMPKFLQRVVNLLPCTLSAESIRSIMSRGWDLSHENVWWGFVILSIHLLLYFLLTIFLPKFVKAS